MNFILKKRVVKGTIHAMATTTNLIMAHYIINLDAKATAAARLGFIILAVASVFL